MSDIEDNIRDAYKKIVNIGATAIVAGTIALMGIGSIHQTGTTQVGVRTVKFSPFAKRGVQEKVYQPGSTYFFLPIINDWTTYDAKLVNMEMSANVNESETGRPDALAFKTRDGNDIDLDVIISYRIDPNKAPYIRQFVASSDQELKQKIVRTITRSKPRDLFGELSSEDFYHAEKRNEAAEKAKKKLQEMLEPYGVIIEKVGSKDYRFNPHYANAIMNKKLADANELKYRSEINARREENVRLLKEAEGQVNEMVAKVDGQYKEAVLNADAYYDKQENIAKAVIAEGEATSAAIKAKREAMISQGGSTLVKMNIAESLKGKKIIMVPSGSSGGNINLQTLNLNDFLKLKGLQNLEDKVDSK